MTREDMFRVFGNIDDSFIVSAEIKRSGKAFGLSETDKGTAESNLSAIIPPQSSAMESTSDKKDPVVSGSGTERTIVMDVVRKKKRKIKIIAVAALIAVTAAAAAVYLGTKKDKNENKEKIITNYFREDSAFDISPDMLLQETIELNGNGLYYGEFVQQIITSSGYIAETVDAGYYICRTDLSGKLIKKIKTDEFGCGADAAVKKIRSIDNGDLWILVSSYDSEKHTESFFLVKTDPELNVKEKIALDKNSSGRNAAQSFYLDFIADSEGQVVLSDQTYKDLVFIDSEGRMTRKDADSSDFWFFRSGDECYCCENNYQSSGTAVYSIDFGDRELDEVTKFDFRISGLSESNGKYDACFIFNDGIYGYNISENKTEELVNWLDSDLDYIPYKSVVLDENTIVAGDYRFGENYVDQPGLGLRLLRRVDDDTLKKVQERRVIDLASVATGSAMTKLVTEFNRTNEKYRIHLEDYSKYEDNSDSWLYKSGLSVLEKEIMKGNTPDIVMFREDFDYMRYIGFNAFDDINGLLAGTDFNRGDYFENILDSMKVNGRQYAVPLAFTLKGLYGNKEVTGDNCDIKLSELREMQAARPLFYGEPYNRIADPLIYSNISEFIDTENYSCDFDNQNFKDVLEIIKECGVTDEEYSEIAAYKPQEDGGLSDYVTRIHKGKCMFIPSELSSFRNYMYNKQWNALKEMTFTGLPAGKKSGAVISPLYSIAVFDSSDKKEGVADFLKFMLSDDAQNTMNSSTDNDMWSLPVKKSVYEELWEQESKIKLIPTTGSDCYGKNYTVKPPNKNVRKIFDNALSSASATTLSDSNIRKIIAEQTEIYLAGGQTAEETAANIQKKVTMYLKEIK
ncbi:MAG: extracellular solute-binding protein [Oscillospiraceae bacterium]|nr:extracellular solute-binding protein [Oscillospiraceae bacterium]